MNKDTIKGEWNQLKGNAKQKWAELTDDDLTHVEGSRDKLIGKIQERYGQVKEEVEKQVDEWIAMFKDDDDKDNSNTNA